MTSLHITAASRRAVSARLASILLYGTFAILMFGPLSFGAVEPWSIFLLEAGTSALVLLWVGKNWLDGDFRIRINSLFLPMSAFGILVLLQIAFHTTAYPHDTVSGALLYATYAMLCFLSAQTLLRASQARKIAMILTIYGFSIAAFSLLQGISPNGKLYWVREPHLGGWIYGPYVNHNHYAGLMEMLIPIPLVISLSRLVRSRERIAAAVAAAVMATTVLLSGSRGGMLALVVELSVLGIWLVRQRKGLRVAIAAGAFAIVLISLSMWLGRGEITQRVASIASETRSEISGGTRLQIDRDALRMFRRKPLLGWGLGTFPVVYPEFRSFYTNFFVNEAHDDYVQLLAETGIVGFGVMIWFVIVLYRKALPKIPYNLHTEHKEKGKERERRNAKKVNRVGDWTSDVSGAVTLACLVGCTGILVHSAVDFNLQIPANAAFFYVLCTLAASEPFAQPARRRRPIQIPAEEMVPTSEVV